MRLGGEVMVRCRWRPGAFIMDFIQDHLHWPNPNCKEGQNRA